MAARETLTYWYFRAVFSPTISLPSAKGRRLREGGLQPVLKRSQGVSPALCPGQGYGSLSGTQQSPHCPLAGLTLPLATRLSGFCQRNAPARGKPRAGCPRGTAARPPSSAPPLLGAGGQRGCTGTALAAAAAAATAAAGARRLSGFSLRQLHPLGSSAPAVAPGRHDTRAPERRAAT